MSSLADKAITWQNNQLVLLDQRMLPNIVEFIECDSVEKVATAIKDMVVRGAPAIGVAAAYGVVIAARIAFNKSQTTWKELIKADLDLLERARPTAVNLKWAISRMQNSILAIKDEDPVEVLLQVAKDIHHEDVESNKIIGKNGAALLRQESTVLTHCNAGALATGGYGTALGVIRSAYSQHKIKQIYAGETRPWFQGTRLTAWELLQDNIPVTLICDSAAASLMHNNQLSWVIVGADRIARNGDVANKIGTYSLAVMAKQHGVKFMVAAPTSTIDMEVGNGDKIKIEKRSSNELIEYQNCSIGPDNVQVWNPVFDITPAEFVTTIVTEKGVVQHPSQEKIIELMQS